MEITIKNDPLHEELHQAVACIDVLDFTLAKEHLAKAMMINDRAPQVHNLLGVIYHLQGHRDIAMRHYRAAYTFDATYQPAIKNMLICSNNHRVHDVPIYGCDDLTLEERLEMKRGQENV